MRFRFYFQAGQLPPLLWTDKETPEPYAEAWLHILMTGLSYVYGPKVPIPIDKRGNNWFANYRPLNELLGIDSGQLRNAAYSYLGTLWVPDGVCVTGELPVKETYVADSLALHGPCGAIHYLDFS